VEWEGFAYDWELRNGVEVLSTGRLYRDEPVQPGDLVMIGHHQARVREILPAGQDVDGRLVLVVLGGV
jgi:hypothetical protein